MLVLIGSRALKLRIGDMLQRKPIDFDYVCTKDALDAWTQRYVVSPATQLNWKKYYWQRTDKYILEGETNVEFDVADIGEMRSNRMILDAVAADKDTFESSMGMVPSLDMLFTLKTSHRYLKNSPHFWKTVHDYHLMKRLGAVVRPEWQEMLKAREKETYNYAHPKLNQSKMGFFNGDQVNYVYDHDSVHRAVALFERPAYELFQKDGAEVQVDRAKFLVLPLERQLASVVEEACVLAIERSLVPHPGGMTPEQAWRFALSKVCTSITSGWWREFAFEHILDAIRLFKTQPDFWARFQAGVKNGMVVRLSTASVRALFGEETVTA